MTPRAERADQRPIRYDALLLAGGRASRLGGVAKPSLLVGDVSMLEVVLAAVDTAARRIVVGPVDHPSVADVVTREDPPGGGPVAAIAAGLEQVDAATVAVLAADLPFLTSHAVHSLLAAMAPTVDATVLIDDAGRDQLLVSSWRTAALRARLAAIGDPGGQSVRRLFDSVAVARVPVAVGSGQPPPWLDCDTDEDLRRAREWM